MIIKLNGKEYKFDLTGTVGLVYMVQRILGDEKYDNENEKHRMLLYYAAFYYSNVTEDNKVPDFNSFLLGLTSNTLTKMVEFFWKRWAELEGMTDEDGEKRILSKDEDSTKGED